MDLRYGMKPKTIKSIFRRRIDAWARSVESTPVDGFDSTAVAAAIRTSAVVSGGAIASMLLGEPVNDLDVYFDDFEALTLVASYYVARFKLDPPLQFTGRAHVIEVRSDLSDAGKQRLRIYCGGLGVEGADPGQLDSPSFDGEAADPERASDNGVAVAQALGEEASGAEEVGDTTESVTRYRPIFITSNAITLSQGVQVIVRFWGQVDQIHANYDFEHVKNAWTARDGQLHLRDSALTALLSRELVYTGSQYPVCSLFRTRKFIERGWRINAGQLLKMAWQISRLDLSDRRVLEDQLIGVDYAFFCDLIRKLDQDIPVDGSYLFDLIDRIF